MPSLRRALSRTRQNLLLDATAALAIMLAAATASARHSGVYATGLSEVHRDGALAASGYATGGRPRPSITPSTSA